MFEQIVGYIIFGVMLVLLPIVGVYMHIRSVKNGQTQSTAAQYSGNLKKIDTLRRKSRCTACYEWLSSKTDNSTENHKQLSEEEKEVFNNEGKKTRQRSVIELYDNGLAIYLYVYAMDGSYYEWLCEYYINQNELILVPYFYRYVPYRVSAAKHRVKSEVYEITEYSLKYKGCRVLGSQDKPKRELPYSIYNQYVRK
jgi:hypothetical protein